MKLYNTLTKKKEEFVPLQEVRLPCMSVDLRYITLSISVTPVR